MHLASSKEKKMSKITTLNSYNQNTSKLDVEGLTFVNLKPKENPAPTDCGSEWTCSNYCPSKNVCDEEPEGLSPKLKP